VRDRRSSGAGEVGESTRYESCRASSNSCEPMRSTARTPETRLGTFVWPPIFWASTWSMLVPDRIAPPAARGAPESRCQSEGGGGGGAVNVPFQRFRIEQTTDEEQLLLEWVRGSSTLPSFMSRPGSPGPPLHCCGSHCPRETANRSGGWLAAARPQARRPQTRSDSSQGSAMVTPRPRSIIRRESTSRRTSIGKCTHGDSSLAPALVVGKLFQREASPRRWRKCGL